MMTREAVSCSHTLPCETNYPNTLLRHISMSIELYARITELEEYYPTRTEREIFEKYADDIVSSHLTLADDEEPINIIELGAGDGRKTKILLKALLSRGISFEYIPIDISRRAMANLFEAMGQFFKDDTLKVHGIVGDYLDAIEYVTSKYPSRKSALLFIGSSIGNFSRDGATAFLSKIKSKLHSGDVLLLGCDLRKDLETMRRAYSDEQGVTRNFNLNLLTRMNRELGTNFDLKNFEHFAAYNPNVGAMESYLIATKRHTVTMTTADEDNRHDQLTQQDSKPATYQFSFKSFEPIYTECSFKYTPELVQEMLTEAGFNFKSEYLDERSWFVDAIAEVPEFFDD